MSSSNNKRKGICKFCGHNLDDHPKEKDLPCLKCKKKFEICLAQNYGDGPFDYQKKICFVPCGCGPKYYPLGLDEDSVLPLHLHIQSGKLYSFLTPDLNEVAEAQADPGDEDELSLTWQGYTRSPGGKSGYTQTMGRQQVNSMDKLVGAFSNTKITTGESSQPNSNSGHARTYSSGSEDPLSLAGHSNTSDEPLNSGQGSGPSSGDPQWSEWKWSEDHNRYFQAREVAGSWEYIWDEERKPKGRGKGASGKGKGKQKK